MMSRKHYKEFAKILHESKTKGQAVEKFSQYFGSDNPRFDSLRFKKAVKWGK